MSSVSKIPHPLQTAPGTSQTERFPADLDPENIQVDDRKIADLLKLMEQFSRQVNYYNPQLNLRDWRPFFEGSLPVLLAGIARFDVDKLEREFEKLADSIQSQAELEQLKLLFDFIWYELIEPIHLYRLQVAEKGSALSLLLDNLIETNLRDGVLKFIGLTNGANKWYCLGRYEFMDLLSVAAWGLDMESIYRCDEGFRNAPGGYYGRLLALKDELRELAPPFVGVLREFGRQAELALEESIVALSEEAPNDYRPHLGLLFAFLNLYQYLKVDLNQLSTRHLTFFYERVLGIKPGNLQPDHAHIVFELQKHVDQYELKEGIALRDGKDIAKQDILFTLDDGIVLDKAQVVDLRTLYLNPVEGFFGEGGRKERLLEGVYMAPVANKADGLEEALPAGQSWPTLGHKYSKYFAPATPPALVPEPYPQARIGFVLASPVLLLNEGKRTITITLKCLIKPIPCIEPGDEDILIQKFVNQQEKIINALLIKRCYISRDKIVEVQQKGLSDNGLENLLSLLNDQPFAWLELAQLSDTDKYSTVDQEIIKEIFAVRQAFRLAFSGAEEWLYPEEFTIDIDWSGGAFNIDFIVEFSPDDPPITFYDPEVLQEDLQTTLPLVKIELDDAIKYTCETQLYPGTEGCCIERCYPVEELEISLYQFLRHLVIDDSCIAVEVCGVKNVVVQNDENLQDVNDLIYPFGTRPEVIDYDRNFNHDNPEPKPTPGLPPTDPNFVPVPNLVGSNFYIGSQEIFCKNWTKAKVNFNWKDKPSDLCRYYEAYIARPKLDAFGNQIVNPEGFPLYEECAIDIEDFEINIALLEEGKWNREMHNDWIKDQPTSPFGPALPAPRPNPYTQHFNRNLFDSSNVDEDEAFCVDFNTDAEGKPIYEQCITVKREHFTSATDFKDTDKQITDYNVNSENGFIRITLENQDFLHRDYPLVLQRQMMAIGRLPNEVVVDAIYRESATGSVLIFSTTAIFVAQFGNALAGALSASATAATEATSLNTLAANVANATQNTINVIDNSAPSLQASELTDTEVGNIKGAAVGADNLADVASSLANDVQTSTGNAESAIQTLDATIRVIDFFFQFFNQDGTIKQPIEALRPNEPYTPIIKDLSIDYCAKADETDIQLIHLYPFKNTYKPENIQAEPTLLPTHVDEGHLYLGLQHLLPGNNLNLLFQLAEATADSERNKAQVCWHYLRKNEWVELAPGFQLLSDETQDLTRSGIIKYSVPGDIDKSFNTIMPKGLHWLRATSFENVPAIAEVLGIHTQAIRVSYAPNAANDRTILRLEAGQIAKMAQTDSNIKSVHQFYPSFGGRQAEVGNSFYLPLSERLRHKGRGIEIFDYERLALAVFPQIYRAKCISHTLKLSGGKYERDLAFAPGFVSLAIIPDINQLTVSNQARPTAPISLLNEIRDYIKQRISPFIRLKVVNPRYEPVDIKVKVKLLPGKSPDFFLNKLAEEIRQFLAPWANGKLESLVFGRRLYRSDLIYFIETRDYIDYICSLAWRHAEDRTSTCIPGDYQEDVEIIAPHTARSILVAGELTTESLDRPCEKFHPVSNSCRDSRSEPGNFNVFSATCQPK